MTATTRPMVRTQRELDVLDRGAHRLGAVARGSSTSIPCGSDAWSCGRSAFTRSATWMTFAPGWRCTLRMMARLSSAQPASCAFSTPSIDVRDVAQAHRRAVLVGDDERLEAVGLVELIVGRERVVLARAVDVALGLVDVRGDERGAHVLEREPGAGERLRVDLHAHRRLLSAVDRDEADARHLRDLLRQDRVGVVVDLVERQDVASSIASVRIGVSAGLLLRVRRRRRAAARAAGSTPR